MRRVTDEALDVLHVTASQSGPVAVVAAADGGVPEAYLVDLAGAERPQQVTPADDDAAIEAAGLSPDGTRLAVATTEADRQTTVEVLDLEARTTRTLAQVPLHEPDREGDTYRIDWTDDGVAVAVSTEVFDSSAGRFFAVDVLDVDGAGATTLDGRPIFFESRQPRSGVFAPATPLVPVERLAGPTRTETAAAVSAATAETATAVVLASSETYADALAGAPLAVALDAPLLLTGRSELAGAAAG